MSQKALEQHSRNLTERAEFTTKAPRHEEANHDDTTSAPDTKTNMDEQDGQDEDNGTPSRNPMRDLMMFGGQGSANERE